MDQLKVVYIAGSGRTGSTILGQLLDTLDGFFFGGELVDFWQRGMQENRYCGCGVEASRCQVWGPIIESFSLRFSAQDLAGMVKARSEARLKDLATWRADDVVAYPKEFVERSRELYREIQRVTGASVVVDSSKFTHYAKVLEAADGIDLHLVHLVRDPRAVAYSWSKRKQIPDPTEALMVPRFGAVASTLRWSGRNQAALQMRRRLEPRYHLIRYEDYIRQPGKVLAPLFNQLGVVVASQWPDAANRPTLPESHAIWGNPSRFGRGPIRLVPDEEWRTAQPAWTRRLVGAMAAPWLARYGYSLVA